MDFLRKLKVGIYGIMGFCRASYRKLSWKIIQQQRTKFLKKHVDAPRYKKPNEEELEIIEKSLRERHIPLSDLVVDIRDFQDFCQTMPFPPDYHGGKKSGVWHEKLLEHYIAWKLLQLHDWCGSGKIYVDVAGKESPWAHMLGDKKITAYSVDLTYSKKFWRDPNYLKMDATRMNFPDESIDGMSLQCAFEMFSGRSDMDFIGESARVLRPGGKVVISPLYTHTHHCCYSTPEYYGKKYGDPGAEEYIRTDCWDVPTSRKYDVHAFEQRVKRTIEKENMEYTVYVLRNKKEIHESIYMHFVLEIKKNA